MSGKVREFDHDWRVAILSVQDRHPGMQSLAWTRVAVPQTTDLLVFFSYQLEYWAIIRNF